MGRKTYDIYTYTHTYTHIHMRLVGRFLSHGCATLPLSEGVRDI